MYFCKLYDKFVNISIYNLNIIQTCDNPVAKDTIN
jgi:hypothetical protein